WRPEEIDAVAALAEPARRRLYEYVAGRPDAVGRDEAAAALGMSRALVAFHLDRLVDAGLLVPEYRRLSGRSGPGAGRPAKLYRRSSARIGVSIPRRRDDVAARLMAEAIERGAAGGRPRALGQRGPEVPASPLEKRATAWGVELGQSARTAAAGDRPDELRAALVDALARAGFGPRVEADGTVRLTNCPFDALVEDHRDLVCGMNLALMEGFVAGLAATGFTAALDPVPGCCCVALREARPAH
ncbi:MAG TPA: helix-turn-helix domain-containing protein, partial [Candidatus Limnocylindrales bacterium]|nr:helix-turn-helix domain-containing protein [Candidatus Limnocylindrales bacterium]